MFFTFKFNYRKLIVNKIHDYEATSVTNRRYVFQLTIGSVSHDVDLNLINIFDNFPMIQYDVPCTFEELNPPLFKSGCIFTVKTLDGFIGNSITLQTQIASFRTMFQFECLNCDVVDRTDQQYELM